MSLVAGLATSSHLALGSYVAVRRSAPARLQKPSDQGTLTILSDLLHILNIISVCDSDTASREAPWTTATSYRILLVIWQMLRDAAAEIRASLEAFDTVPNSFTPSMLIAKNIIKVVVELHNIGDPLAGLDLTNLDTPDPETLSAVLEEGESLTVRLIRRICQVRSVWAIGTSMATVLEEIMGATQSRGQFELG
ncbi:hypothetical protein P170DRAFT_440372 [Aspergillus steynii IBT 23096]|uniref:Uncharacterized protein n=1 Tax=Aspergillus steynii IBT 23096 TaxID=1392250 RepID=A0A2I2FX54_9EURO|nr:uncharacterized protein P170DRAFT_440372 [Aspergillus steynii IBT 23096]PLB45225.1 hypothetical protein P170DRAFT_440372 [Aspergillus steynii IBT 23096]